MIRIAKLFAVVLAASLSACVSDSTTSPRRFESPRQSLMNTVYDYSTQTLGVSTSGVNHYNSAGSYTYTGGVTGGTPPYTYDWFMSYCTADYSFCSDLSEIQGGTSNQVSLNLTADYSEVHLQLHVYDSSGLEFSGSASPLRVINTIPSANVTSQNSLFICEPDFSFYPVLDFNGKHFRRDLCDGTVHYDPTGA